MALALAAFEEHDSPPGPMDQEPAPCQLRFRYATDLPPRPWERSGRQKPPPARRRRRAAAADIQPRKCSPIARAVSLHPEKVTRRDRRIVQSYLSPQLGLPLSGAPAVEALSVHPVLDRLPRTRAECLPGGRNEMRPCPFISCRHHLATEVDQETGSLKITFPMKDEDGLVEPDLERMPATCALDIADAVEAGEEDVTLERLGAFFNLSIERANQLVARSQQEVLVKIRRLGLAR